MDHLDLGLVQDFRPRYHSSSDCLKFSPGDDFFAFPDKPGYEWEETTGKPMNPNSSVNQFYQQWLYFGLLHTVLEGISIEQDRLIDNHQINTNILGTWLKQWENKARELENPRELTMRMIRAQMALDKARQIVSKLCEFDWDTWGPRKDDEWQAVRERIDRRLVLSLLILGETLTNAKSKITERLGYTIQGWHGNANEGWGVSAALVIAMQQAGWCKRAVYVLAYQLRQHATALLAARQAYNETSSLGHRFHALQGHNSCTKDECKFKSEDNEKNYTPMHRQDCPPGSSCEMIGPTERVVIETIEAGKIPLLRFDESNSKITVEPFEPGIIYTAVSHVWSDGHGNRHESKLFKCQLKYLSELIRKSRWYSNNNSLFWMDTLAIPRDRDARKKAVSRIDEVYRRATSTIVLDLGLYSISSGTSYHDTALKVLASGWMRRLWTLQEAYLSHKITFAFNDLELIEVDDLEERYRRSTHQSTSNLPAAARAYFFHIMGEERLARNLNRVPENRYDLIASVWRSAQWRTIHRKTDEPIVLEALFELNRKRALAARGLPNGKQDLAITRHNIKDPHNPDKEDRLRLAGMMRELWIELEEQSPGCIPSGIIFLPGERLGLEGFGWAPRSWMIGKEIDYPDPLSLPQSTARLIHGKGLCVQYSGFLLHCRDPQDVFWPEEPGTPYVQFPCDSTLGEWYKIRKAEPFDKTALGTALEKMRFAIILCRPKPREREEIALLVNIIDETHPGRHGSSMFTKVYKADIICRILIQRAMGIDRSGELRQLMSARDSQNGPGFICGEELPSNQEWIVDAYLEEKCPADTSQHELTQDDTPSQEPRSRPDANLDSPRTRTFINASRHLFPRFNRRKGHAE